MEINNWLWTSQCGLHMDFSVLELRSSSLSSMVKGFILSLWWDVLLWSETYIEEKKLRPLLSMVSPFFLPRLWVWCSVSAGLLLPRAGLASQECPGVPASKIVKGAAHGRGKQAGVRHLKTFPGKLPKHSKDFLFTGKLSLKNWDEFHAYSI